ncbi:MAG: hypothetical protein Q7O66_22465, partial [Dehalococcoidia bacterium]|nr:hypothetical protein [Dehalococcoidia bacterium]
VDMLPRYEVLLLEGLDLATGQMRRVPVLDNSKRFWLSPDGNRAAFLLRDHPRQIFAGLAMLDFGSLAVTPIPDSIIRAPSETIPYNHASFSHDGSFFAWADWDGGTSDLYISRANGSGMSKMFSLFGVPAFSPDLTKIAYGSQSMVKVLNLDGSGAVEIGPGAPFAWRP